MQHRAWYDEPFRNVVYGLAMAMCIMAAAVALFGLVGDYLTRPETCVSRVTFEDKIVCPPELNCQMCPDGRQPRRY